MFKCPICLELSEHKTRKEIEIYKMGALSVCPFCYHVIMTLRKSKKEFEVEIQKLEVK